MCTEDVFLNLSRFYWTIFIIVVQNVLFIKQFLEFFLHALQRQIHRKIHNALQTILCECLLYFGSSNELSTFYFSLKTKNNAQSKYSILKSSSEYLNAFTPFEYLCPLLSFIQQVYGWSVCRNTIKSSGLWSWCLPRTITIIKPSFF